MTVVKAAPLSVGKMEVEAIPLKKSQSSVCSSGTYTVYQISKCMEMNTIILETQNIIKTQVICFYLLVTGLFLFESIPH